MATGFGFCPNCGTAMTVPGQRFCASCGATVPAMGPVPAAAQAPAAMPAPPPPAPVAAMPPAWPMPPAIAQVAPARTTVSPTMLLVGGVIIAAIVGGAVFAMNNGSKNSPISSGSLSSSGSPTPSGGSNNPTIVDSTSSPGSSGGSNGGYPGSIVFSPATIGCPSQSYTTTVRLPSSVNGTDQITYQIDETTIITQAVTDFGLTQQADGTWSVTDTNPDGSSNCSMGPGAHTARLLDSSGNVLAQGSFTFVMSPSPSPTPSPSPLAESSVTIEPSSFSCSGSAVDVTLTIRLSASIPGSAQITSESDGTAGSSASVESALKQQSDGTWLGSTTNTSSTLCGEYDPGDHRIGVLDANGQVIAEGTFTVNP